MRDLFRLILVQGHTSIIVVAGMCTSFMYKVTYFKSTGVFLIVPSPHFRLLFKVQSTGGVERNFREDTQ